MAHGREERQENEQRRKREEERNRENRFAPPPADQWRPERRES